MKSMPGVAELLLEVGWKLLPEDVRQKLTNRLLLAEARAAITIPKTEAVTLTSSANRGQFYTEVLSEGNARAGKELPRASLILTCRNEEKSIGTFLDSIARQTQLPNEVVIYDGGSTDQTVPLIKKWHDSQKTRLFDLRLIEGTPSSIAAGRNRAAEAARYEVLLLTDAGTMLDKDWAKHLLEPLATDPTLDAVMGWYRPIVELPLQAALAHFLVPSLDTIDAATFLPSARSLALRRSSLLAVGGYPEHLSRAGEDSLFDYYLKTVVKRVAFAPEAICYWRMPRDIGALFRTIAGYARGDAEGGVIAWRYYLTLLSHALKLGIEGFALLLTLMLALVAGSALLLILPLALSVLFARRLWQVYLSYQPFHGADTPAERLWRLVALSIMCSAQVYGFISGYRARPQVEQRRIGATTKGHLVLLLPEPLHYDPTEKHCARFQQLLTERWYVTALYASQPTHTAPIFEHPQSECYRRSEFRLDAWQEKHHTFLSNPQRSFAYLDLCNDGLSRELSQALEKLGATVLAG
ncbi:MAG: glycosyltransferase [Bdellovibrionales bacterium]|nr:glycosyltransferase [Bdellovibrionales bacterium]